MTSVHYPFSDPTTGFIINRLTMLARQQDPKERQYYRAQLDAFVQKAQDVLRAFTPEVINACPLHLRAVMNDMLNYCHDIDGVVGGALEQMDQEDYTPACSHCQDTDPYCPVCVL